MFDQNMLNELSKLKVDRKRRRTEEDEVDYEGYKETGDEQDEEYEDIPSEEEIYEEVDIDHVEDSPSLSNLSEFISDTIAEKDLDPNKFIGETSLENDYSTEESRLAAETKEIVISGRKAVKVLDKDGNEVKSKYMDEVGNLNVVYGEPGKNVVNRKSIEEQRLDVKMEALSGLISKFKSEEEIKAEENDKNVIMMDKNNNKKDLKSMEQIVQISSDLDMKVSMVTNTFKRLSEEIQSKAGLPDIDFNITSSDYLRALYMNKSVDDMDVSRIFTLALFLEGPEMFPTHDTYEQVQYRNSQVGAKSKSIELKKLITYLSSDSEFNATVDQVASVSKNPGLDLAGIKQVFKFKSEETLKALMSKYLKPDSTDLANRVNIISIKKEVQFKYRNMESTLSFLDSLKGKLKVLPATLKDQIKKTSEQIAAAEEKINNLKESIKKMEGELTIMAMLNIANQGNGYDLTFSRNIPKEEIEKQLLEFNVNIESVFVQNLLNHGIKEETFNEILKNR